MCEPLVSVVIPVYNGSNYLTEAIESVLNQTYPNIEIIVVNDGSNDNGETEHIALSYGDRIQYVYKENGGVATALNAGIGKMQGEYFSWLSHDDVFYPEKIQRQMECIKKEKVNIVACAYHIFYDSGKRIPISYIDLYGNELVQNSVFSVLHALIQFGGILFHKSIFDKYGIFREDLRTTQDYEFLFRILRREKCVYDGELLYGIRYHEMQGSRTIADVDMERDQMYCMFMHDLTADEKCTIYGSIYCFYYQMLLRVWPMPNIPQAVKQCLKGLTEAERWDEYRENGDKELPFEPPVLIYGAGIYGRRLLFDLRCRGIETAGFLDGNSKLWGQDIEGVQCYSLQDVLNGKLKGTIIIASLFREEIADTLRNNGIESFLYKEEYDRKAITTAPERKKILDVIAKYERNKIFY